MPQSSTFTAQLALRKTRAADFNPAEHQATLGGFVSIENGLLASQCDLAWSDKARSLAASANESLDLNGSLVDDLGSPVNFARVNALIIVAADTNTNDLIVGGAATNAFVGPFGANTHTMAVKPGGTLVLIASKGAPGAAGWPVTAATADLLRLANGGAGSAVVFDIAIIGRSA
jgi:hypothetical protein